MKKSVTKTSMKKFHPVKKILSLLKGAGEDDWGEQSQESGDLDVLDEEL